MLHRLSLAAILSLAVVVAVYFNIPLSLWVIALFGITYSHTGLGAALLFLTCSIDSVAPFPGEIFVSYSEVLLAAGVLGLFAKADLKYVDLRPLKWSLPFLLAVFVSGLANIECYKVLPHVLRASELFVASFLAHNAFRRSRTLFKYALAAAFSLSVLTAFLQFVETGQRPHAFFSNPNQFAGYLGLLAPFLLAFFLCDLKQKIRFLWSTLFLLSALGLLMSNSRAAMAAFCVSTLGVSLAYLRKRLSTNSGIYDALRELLGAARILAVPGLVVVALFALALTNESFRLSVSLRFSPGAKQWGISESLRTRRTFMEVGYRAWKDNWLFGVGPGRWDNVVDDYLSVLEESGDRTLTEDRAIQSLKGHVHNLYLQLAADFGILGLATFLYWLARVSILFFRGPPLPRRDAPSSEPSSQVGDSSCNNLSPILSEAGSSDWSWKIAGVGMLAGFLVQNLLDVTFPSLALETGFLVGAVSGAILNQNGTGS